MRTYALAAISVTVMAQTGEEELAGETTVPTATYGGLSSSGEAGEWKITDEAGDVWYGFYIDWETVWADGLFTNGTWVSTYLGEASKTESGFYDYVTCNVSFVGDGLPAPAERVVIEVCEGQPLWMAQADALDQTHFQDIPRPTGCTTDQTYYIQEDNTPREEAFASTYVTSPSSSSQRCALASMPYWCEGESEDCHSYQEAMGAWMTEMELTEDDMHDMKSADLMTGFRIYTSGATGNAQFGADAVGFTYESVDWGIDWGHDHGDSGAASVLASVTAFVAILMF